MSKRTYEQQFVLFSKLGNQPSPYTAVAYAHNLKTDVLGTIQSVWEELCSLQ